MTLVSGRREKIADLIVWVSFFPCSVHKRFRILARLNKKRVIRLRFYRLFLMRSTQYLFHEIKNDTINCHLIYAKQRQFDAQKSVNSMPISRLIWFSWMNYASISLKITCNNSLYSKLFMELFKHHFFFIAKIRTRPASIAVVVKCF